jgi:hypothetical protein
MSIKRQSHSRSSVDSGTGGGGGPTDLIDKLMEMGISERSAQFALKVGFHGGGRGSVNAIST